MAKRIPIAHIEGIGEPTEPSHDDAPKAVEVTLHQKTSPVAAQEPTPGTPAKSTPEAEQATKAAKKATSQGSPTSGASAAPKAHIDWTPAAGADDAFDRTEDPDQKAATPGSDGPASSETVAARAADLGREATSWVSRTFPGHEHAVLGGVAGLVAAIMVFVVGFWQMLFVGAMVVVGVAIGQLLDGDPKIVRALRRLLELARGAGDE